VEVKRFEVWIANLDLTIGAEIKKPRPVVIVSPDELNRQLRTVVAVPLTTGRSYPFRIGTRVRGKAGVAAIDQIRTFDKSRLVNKVATIRPATATKILDALVQMFEP